MGIFDIFTGDPAKKAAEQQRSYFDQVNNTARTDIQNGQTTSLANIGQGYDTARNDLTGGFNDAQGALTGAAGAYDPLKALSAKYGGATTMALNSLGVNGQGGTDAARSAFTAGPAYNFNMEQGLDAINRSRNARGMVNSGNTDRDAQKFGAGLASNEYDKWMGSLLGFTNPELGATGVAASGLAGLGRDSATLDASRGTGLAGLDTWQGKSLADINTNATNARVGAGQANAGAYGQTYKTAADAQMAGSGNMWNMGMNVAKMAMGMPPIGGGFPGMGDSSGNPGSLSFGSNPFTPSGGRNPAYG